MMKNWLPAESGFAALAKLLAAECGVPCITVYGAVDGAASAWNMCFVQERWLAVDLYRSAQVGSDLYVMCGANRLPGHVLSLSLPKTTATFALPALAASAEDAAYSDDEAAFDPS